MKSGNENNENREIEKMCRSCEWSETMANDEYVLCERHGVVASTSRCRHFIYDPLKRFPPQKIKAPELEYVDIESEE